MGVRFIIIEFEHRQAVVRLLLQLLTQRNLIFPELVNRLGEFFQRFDIIVTVRSSKCLVPGVQKLDFCRLQLFDDFVGITAHTGVAQQKMIDLCGQLAALALGAKGNTLRGFFIPAQTFAGGLQGTHAVALPPGTNQGIAVDQLGTEPRHKSIRINGVQPQRNLGQFHGHRVQVNAVYIAVGNEHFDLLQLVKTFFVADDLSGFLLFTRNIGSCKLIDRFIQECCAAHGRFTNG